MTGFQSCTCLMEKELDKSFGKPLQSQKFRLSSMLLVYGDGCVSQCSTRTIFGGKCSLSQHGIVHLACMPYAKYTMHRFLCCRDEYFLLDTGAGSSWLRFPDMYNVTVQDPTQKREYQQYGEFGLFVFACMLKAQQVETLLCVAEMQLLGQPIFFGESKYCNNPGIRNINLLSVDFLNQFILIDDNIGKYLQVLTRPNPKPFLRDLPM